MYSRSVGYQSFDWASGRQNSSCPPELCWCQRRRWNAGPTSVATDWKRPDRCRRATGWRRPSTFPRRRRRHWKWCSYCPCWSCRHRTRTSTQKSCHCCSRRPRYCRRRRCWCYWCCCCWCCYYGTGNGCSACSTWPAVCVLGPRGIYDAHRRRRDPATPAAVCSTDARRWRPPWWAIAAMAPSDAPDCPTIRPTTVASSHSSDTWWPAANPCPSSSGPSAVGCRTRNCRSCSSTSHCCCGARSRRPRKSDLFCNGVNVS